MSNRKKLLFVHDALPAEGISGMIVFLRHFTRLQNWDIKILIPENAYKAEIIKSYPTNFSVNTFPLRKTTWPPFREGISLLVKIRLWILKNLFRKALVSEKPDVVVSVLFHYYSVALSEVTRSLHIPFILFLHDRWDLKTNDSKAQLIRLHEGKKTLLNSTYILSVTDTLIAHYKTGKLSNGHIFFPIPGGYLPQYTEVKNEGINLLYAGTIEAHHLRFFTSLIPILDRNHFTLTIVTNSIDKVKEALGNNERITYMPSFERNIEVLEFIDKGRYIMLVNYGFDESDNPFVMNSFPSKFVEFTGLHLPIIAIAYEYSPFYKLLLNEHWPLLFNSENINTLEPMLKKLTQAETWNKACLASEEISEKYFLPERIQSQFETYLQFP